ncbi:autotransporter outer membrane beta-barrel domain-containing protein [Erwinia sp. V71]
MWEVGAGATVNVKNDLAFYAEADYRREVGDSGARGWRYNAGVRWQF